MFDYTQDKVDSVSTASSFWIVPPVLLVLAGRQFLASPSLSGTGRGWDSDFLVLLSVSGALSFALMFVRVPVAKRYLIASKVLVFLLTTSLAETTPGIDALLATVLLLETGLYFVPLAAVAIALCVLVTVPAVYSFFHVLPDKVTTWRTDGNAFFGIAPPLIFLLALSRIGLLHRLDRALGEMQALDRAARQLTTANAGFLQYASTVEHTTVSNERRRLSRELHDVVGQTFTNITSMMDAVIRNQIESRAELAKLHQWVRDHAQWGLQESRRALYRLRSMKEFESSGIPALTKLFKTFEQATNVTVHVQWRNLPWTLPDETDLAIYRTVQESMVNSFRHGKATAIEVAFWYSGQEVQLSIHDNGGGGPVDHAGIGQAGMRERIAAAGGTIEFINERPGYLVRAAIPMRPTGGAT